MVMPWLPPGHTMVLPGRGEVFYRHHRHPDPTAPTLLLLHGWTASADLQFFTAYEALAEHYSFVAIDHRGHGRGMRSPATVRTGRRRPTTRRCWCRRLGIGPGDHRRLLDGRADQPAADPAPPRAGARHGGAGHCARVAGQVVRAAGVEDRARARPAAAVGRLPALDALGHPPAARARTTRWSSTCRGWPARCSRNDAFSIVQAGQSLSRYDARACAAALGKPAASLITTRDRLVKPRKQRALADALNAVRGRGARRPPVVVDLARRVRQGHRATRAARRRLSRLVRRRGSVRPSARCASISSRRAVIRSTARSAARGGR